MKNNKTIFLDGESPTLDNAFNYLASKIRHLESCPLSVEKVETYSGPCQISTVVIFAKIFNGFQSLTIFAKRFIIDVWQGSEYLFETQEPAASNNFFLSQLWIISPTYRLVFVRMQLHLVSFSQSQSMSNLLDKPTLRFTKFCLKFNTAL